MKDRSARSLKQRLARVVFETDTPWAKGFDIVLLVAILLSVLLVIVETVGPVREAYQRELYIAEWGFTVLFTVEYLGRLFLARRAAHYAVSFYGVIDLLAILPSYLELFVAGPHYLMVIRVLRLLRLFRVLKLTRYVKAEENIKAALRAARAKIVVFFGSVLAIMTVIGALMYLIEGPANGFDNIPISVYWALNTMTPVSESDLVAKSVFGQAFAALLMFLGYALLAIPTGILSSEITRASLDQKPERHCPACGRKGHEASANYCMSCGAKLPEVPGTEES